MRSNIACIFFMLLLPSLSLAATPDYHRSIRPILRQSCVGCHNPNRKAGELDLSSYASILAGSSSGKVVEPGLPEDSLLYLVVTHEEEPAMPPEGDRLDDKKLAILRTWIEFGMPEKAADAKTAVSLRPKDKPAPTAGSTDMPAQMEEVSVLPSAEATDRLVYQPERGNAITALAATQGLIARSAQNQVILYDAAGQFMDVLSYPEGDVFDLHFSPDGKQLFAAGGTHAASGQVVLWDTASRERIAEYGDEFDIVLAADSTPDGSMLVFGGAERLIKIVDTKTGSLEHKLDKHTDWVFDIAINPDGLVFASADRAGNLFVWETASGQHIHTLRGHRGAITEIDWLHKEDAFVTVGEDGTVRIWDVHQGRQVATWKASDKGLLGVSVSPDDTIHTIARSGDLTTWDRNGNKLATRRIESMPTEVESLDDKATVAIGTWNGDALKVGEQTGISTLTVPSAQTTVELASLMVSPRRSMDFRKFEAASLTPSPASIANAATSPSVDIPSESHQLSLIESAATYFSLQETKLAEEAKDFANMLEKLNQVRDEISDLERRYSKSYDKEALRSLVAGLKLHRQQAAKARYSDIELLLQIAEERANSRLQQTTQRGGKLTTSDALILKSCQRTIAELTEAISNRLVASNNDSSLWSKLGTQLAEVQNRASKLSGR